MSKVVLIGFRILSNFPSLNNLLTSKFRLQTVLLTGQPRKPEMVICALRGSRMVAMLAPYSVQRQLVVAVKAHQLAKYNICSSSCAISLVLSHSILTSPDPYMF